jgi:hypothetical protein
MACLKNSPDLEPKVNVKSNMHPKRNNFESTLASKLRLRMIVYHSAVVSQVQ